MQFLGALIAGIGLVVTIVTLMAYVAQVALVGATVGHQVAFQGRDREEARTEAKEFVASTEHGFFGAFVIGLSLLSVGFFMAMLGP